MLVLTRKTGSRIHVNGPCEVVLVESKDGRAKLGVIAEQHVSIVRDDCRDGRPRINRVEKD